MEGLTYVLAPLLPFVVDFVNKNVENSKLRFIIAMSICLLVGFATKFRELTWTDTSSALMSGGIIFTEATAVYHLLYKDSAVQRDIRNIHE